jgi:hypothetical protein
LAQVKFTDPRTGNVYNWQVNPPYTGIQPQTKARQIQRTSNTANVGVTKQQGDDGPLIIHWQVAVFHAHQQEQMWWWYQLCKRQTIFLTDWEGNEYEGQIISMQDQWTGLVGGPGDATARGGYSQMEMQFEVYRFVSGYMATAGVLP